MKDTTWRQRAERAERFGRYRVLWARLCVLGSRMREARDHAGRGCVLYQMIESEYAAVLAAIRRVQAEFDRQHAAA